MSSNLATTKENPSRHSFELNDSYKDIFLKAEGSEDCSTCSSTEDSTSVPLDHQNSKEFRSRGGNSRGGNSSNSSSSSSESYNSESYISHDRHEESGIVIFWERNSSLSPSKETSGYDLTDAEDSQNPNSIRPEEDSPEVLKNLQNKKPGRVNPPSSEESSQCQLPAQETQAASSEGRPLVPFDANHKRSNSLVGTQSLVPALDPEEEGRRRHEVNHAMEALEHMRRANLLVEFGPNVNFDACVHCLRASRDRTNEANPLEKALHPLFKRKKKFDSCLICQSPVCNKHMDADFVERRVILCQECAPLFDLDVLIDFMQNNNHSKLGEESNMRKLLNLYDRALLALRYSSQNFDDTAQLKLQQTYRNKEGLGLGSTVTSIASGVTGLAGTAAMLTPLGPSLLLASLVLGGIATAVGSGSYLVEQLCPQTQQAEQTIALASMVDSLLEATSLLREARLTSTPRLPLLENGRAESKDGNSPSRLPLLENGSTALEDDNIPADQQHEDERPILFLEQDKEQLLLISTLKGALEPHKEQQILIEKVKRRKAREQRSFGFLFRNDKEGDRTSRHNKGMDSEARFDKILQDVEEEEKQGSMKKAARRVGMSLSKTKDRAGEAASVAKTAATLAAVGMSAGTSTPSGIFNGHFRRKNSKDGLSNGNKREPQNGFQLFLDNLFNGQPEPGRKNDRQELVSEKDDKGNHVVKHDRVSGKGNYANGRFGNILDRAVVMFSARHSSMNDVDTQERCLVAKIRLKNTELMLKSSTHGIRELTRTGFNLAKQQARNARSSFVNRHGQGPSSSDRLVVKNARFVAKAVVSVLRETARFAGGVFSAAIVCVETVELKQSMDRIRAGNPCATAEHLQRLRQDVWSNQSAFPDTRTFEQELFFIPPPNYPDESNDTTDGQASSESSS